jgi:hypothetical protein
MPSPYGEYLEKIRTRAREQAVSSLRDKAKTMRQRERILRKRGLGGPFDDLTHIDIKRMKVEGTYEALLDVEDFRHRVAKLDAEKADWLASMKEAEDAAILHADTNLPPSVAMSRDHERARRIFLTQHGVEDIGRAPAQVQDQYRNLVDGQERELRDLNGS